MSSLLPTALRRAVEGQLEEVGIHGGIEEMRPVSGGCVNPSLRLEVAGGERLFLKWNGDAPDIFPKEAAGLGALRHAAEGRVRVPEVIGMGGGRKQAPGWLLMEFISKGRATAPYWRALAEGIAHIHRPAAGSFGWEEDNHIGPLPQSNTPSPDWVGFWREERLLAQLAIAHQGDRFSRPEVRLWDAALDRMDHALPRAAPSHPSLLHGDLWSGNVYAGPAGEPVVIDPAVYRGDPEVDLAMTELFGGFAPEFHRRYEEARPGARGERLLVRDIYRLYPLLVHVNLFGGAYVPQTVTTLRRILAH